MTTAYLEVSHLEQPLKRGLQAGDFWPVMLIGIKAKHGRGALSISAPMPATKQLVQKTDVRDCPGPKSWYIQTWSLVHVLLPKTEIPAPVQHNLITG